MCDGARASLPDGDFFMLKDGRAEMNVLSGRTIRVPETEDSQLYDQHDHDPARSKELSMARRQRLRELESIPDLTRPSYTLFRDRRFRFDPSLISNPSHFYGPPPQAAIHYDILTDFSVEPLVGLNGDLHQTTCQYDFVSNEWKAAVESLEPGVHEFFPHELEFSSYTMYGHFIFRDCLELDFVDLERSGPGGVQRTPLGGLTVAYDPVGLAARGEVVAGRHWIRQIGVDFPFVSRALALKLLPLLPEVLENPEPFSFRPVLLV